MVSLSTLGQWDIWVSAYNFKFLLFLSLFSGNNKTNSICWWQLILFRLKEGAAWRRCAKTCSHPVRSGPFLAFHQGKEKKRLSELKTIPYQVTQILEMLAYLKKRITQPLESPFLFCRQTSLGNSYQPQPIRRAASKLKLIFWYIGLSPSPRYKLYKKRSAFLQDYAP